HDRDAHAESAQLRADHVHDDQHVRLAQPDTGFAHVVRITRDVLGRVPAPDADEEVTGAFFDGNLEVHGNLRPLGQWADAAVRALRAYFSAYAYMRRCASEPER